MEEASYKVTTLLIKNLIKLTLPFVFGVVFVMVLLLSLLMCVTTLLGAKSESTFNISNGGFNPIEGSISNGQSSQFPIFKPKNKNLWYALVAIRSAEANRPDHVYFPNDFTSCGNYQQLMGELIGDNPKATKAKEIMGIDYNRILEANKSDLQRWTINGLNNVQDGEIIFEPIYRGGSFVGWARTIPNKGTMICKELVTNHLKTGLFDQIALTRLESRGLLPYLESYNLNVNNTYNFALTLCRSQVPVSCLDWVERSEYWLKQYLATNKYENL